VVLYEMLTGTSPFNGDNLSAIVYQVLNAEPAPPSTVNSRVPPAFDRIIRRALARRPEDRYQTAREFAKDLKNPDAAPAETAHRPPERIRPAKVPQARGLPDDDPATVLLQPGRGRTGAAAVSAEAGARKSRAAGPRRSGKALWLALPVALVAVAALVTLGLKPDDGPAPTAPATPAAQAPTPPASPDGDAAQPVAAPAIKSVAEAAVKAEAEPVGEPEVAPAVEPPAKPAARPAVAPARDVAVRATQAKAIVVLAVSPWGEVYVDGRSAGVSPPLTVLQIEAGRHDLEIRNQAFAPYREAVNLKSGETLKIRHKFK
jgi:serine/threonine-protein kinase